MKRPRRPALADVVIVHHELKEWAEYFRDLWSRARCHEVRRDDRRIPFAPGQTMKISEYVGGGIGSSMVPTGRWVRGTITSVTRGKLGSNADLPEGLAVLTFAEHARSDPAIHLSPTDTALTPPDRGNA